MNAIVNAIKDVLYDTWPMIALSCVVLISLRVAYLKMHKKKIIVSEEIMSLAFIVYILCMFQIVTSQDVSGIHGVNITLFKELTRYEIGSRLFYRNIIGNIVLFIPFGFFTSYYLKLNRKTFIFCLALIVSIVIELIQLKIGRAFDIDDIVLNTLGSFLGYYLYRLVDMLVGELSETVKGTLTIIALLMTIVLVTIIII